MPLPSFRSIARTTLVVASTLAIACGGDDGPTPPPTPEPVASVEVSPTQSDLRTGETVQLQVTLRDAAGTVLTGRTIAYTTSDGTIAAVDNAGLVTAGTRGNATVTVTSEGRTAQATFDVLFPDFQPTGPTALSGDNDFETFDVGGGITVTLSGGTVVRVVGAANVAGTITGNCTPLNLVAGGAVTLTGTVDNGCTDAAQAADLRIVSGGALTLTGTQVTSSGSVDITNDSTLTDDDFDLTPAFRYGSTPPRAAVQGSGPCVADGSTFTPTPPNRPNGVDGTNGGDGSDGHRWALTCNGDGVITGGTRVSGQGAGNGFGGDVTGGAGDSDLDEQGGDGGDAGRLDVRVTGKLDFPPNAAVRFVLGNGGDGGSRTVTATAPSGNATATGGDGGESGTLRVSANGGITIGPGGIIIEPGTPGTGGNAIAVAGDGTDAGAAAATPGGTATATAGEGGDSPRARLRSRGNVTGLANVTVLDAPGGVGGDARATGGKGGDGNEMFPPGADGGGMTATAGEGGEARATGTGDAPIGIGGMGGSAFIFRGLGGIGWNGCSVMPHKAGGDGGKGGNGSVTSGEGGDGSLTDGDPGSINVPAGTGDGGMGGDGEGPGSGGSGGSKAANANGGANNDMPLNFQDGADGVNCPAAVMIEVGPAEMAVTHVIGSSPCPQLVGTFTVRNIGTAPVNLQLALGSTALNVSPGGATDVAPGALVTFQVLFNCSTQSSFSSQVDVIATPAGSGGTGGVTVPVFVAVTILSPGSSTDG